MPARALKFKMTDQTFQIKTPVLQWYVAGLVMAMAIPLTFGLLSIAKPLSLLELGCFTGELGGCSDLRNYVRRHPVEIPVSLTFIFGTLLAGGIGAFKVKRKISSIEKPIYFGSIGIGAASWAHFIAAFVYSMVLAHISPGDEVETMILFSIFVHGVLWLFVTAPLALLCGMIFRWTAVEKNGGL